MAEKEIKKKKNKRERTLLKFVSHLCTKMLNQAPQEWRVVILAYLSNIKQLVKGNFKVLQIVDFI